MWIKKDIDRKRKTKAPCEGCGLGLDLCICSELQVLDLKTRLSLIIHRREVQKTTNTGMLALKILKNSQRIVRGEIDRPTDLSSCILEDYENLLLYPSEDAQELTSEFVSKLNKPIHLLVPDGNWRQASKVHYRHKEISELVRVTLPKPSLPMDQIRKETKENGMATLHAIAIAMGVIEGKSVEEILFKAFEQKLKNTMQARGLR